MGSEIVPAQPGDIVICQTESVSAVVRKFRTTAAGDKTYNVN